MNIKTIIILLSVTFLSSCSTEQQPIVAISDDAQSIEIKLSPESSVKSVDVLNECGDPEVGEAKIRHVQVHQNTVEVTYGKHCSATVSLKTHSVVQCGVCD